MKEQANKVKVAESPKLPFELSQPETDQSLFDLRISDDLRKELLELPEEKRLEVLKALAEDLHGNLENEEPEFPQIRILHSAALFEFPDGTKEETFRGVMIEILPARAWWEPIMSTERVPPECYSRDWIRPDPEAPRQQAKTCAECSWNAWGSAVDPQGKPTRGKACRMRKRIFLQLENHEIPFVLSVPPMSLKSLRTYLVGLSDGGIQKNRCETEFRLELKEDGVQEFSTIGFEKIRELSLAEYLKAREKKENYLSSMRAAPIGVDEFEVKEETGTEESTPPPNGNASEEDKPKHKGVPF